MSGSMGMRKPFYEEQKVQQIFLFGILAVCGMLTFYIALMTPMHSDDYGDYFKELTFAAIEHKYMS